MLSCKRYYKDIIVRILFNSFQVQQFQLEAEILYKAVPRDGKKGILNISNDA